MTADWEYLIDTTQWALPFAELLKKYPAGAAALRVLDFICGTDENNEESEDPIEVYISHIDGNYLEAIIYERSGDVVYVRVTSWYQYATRSQPEDFDFKIETLIRFKAKAL